MEIKEEDLLKITEFTSKLIENVNLVGTWKLIKYVTCEECCKLYIAPKTAPCGYTLCHKCWRERLICPHCAKPINCSTLKLNQSMQKLKENVQTIVRWIKVQKHFSAPCHSEEIELPKPLSISPVRVKAQIHSAAKAKIPEPKKVVYVSTVPQDDWDKIEPLNDTEGSGLVSKKGFKENVIGPMDIEPFCTLQYADENQYTANNPRRSSRKTELKPKYKNIINNKKNFIKQNIQTNISKVPFYKKSALNPSNSRISTEDNINTMNQIIESNTKSNDDIDITIKVANTLANVLIKRQANMQLKLHTDREIQTEPAPSEILVSTAKLRSKTQKSCEKRCRSGEDVPTPQPRPKKVKWGETFIITNSAGRDDSEVTVPLASLAEKVAHEEATSIAGEVLTPVLCEPLDNDVEMASNASHDKSVVEETPHKSSFTKVKKSNGTKRDNKNVTQTQEKELPIQKPLSEPETEDINSIDSNSIDSNSDTSISTVANETVIWKTASGTPLTIDRFVSPIQHKSTPYATKTLNIDTLNDDVILCATSEGVGNTTQESESMLKTFEKTLTTVVKPTVRSLAVNHKKYVIAGSSLRPREIEILKRLCAKNNWSYLNQYTSELTHLVVKADADNKGQRTIKYIRALAASKWIISFEWVVKCIQSQEPAHEEDFEVMDSTGYPGPMKSRLATRKLFEGIKFFCKEPFTDLGTHLQEIITSSGGTVVDSMKAVRVLGECSPALLLAEPEHTQVSFTYIAKEHNIVPVNYMWVMECLGTYTLHSIHKLLLCSPTLLPKPTQHWPRVLLAVESEDDDE